MRYWTFTSIRWIWYAIFSALRRFFHASRQAGRDSYILMLKHGKVSGTMELSTCYGWSGARETLSVNTGAGLYRLEGTEKLSFEPRPAVAAGIPLEKIGLGRRGTKVLFERNSFSPVLKENPVYIQGFFDEVRDFAQCTQGRRQKLLSSQESIRDTYKLIEDLRKIQP